MANKFITRKKPGIPRHRSRVVPFVTSCLYECHVMHARFAPKAHRFAYRIFLFAIDLDELPLLHRRLRLFSFARRNLYRFNNDDYLPAAQPPANLPIHSVRPPENAPSLKARVLDRLAADGIDLTGGRVLLVTLPRVLGYLFNPVSFYFCYDRTGTPVAAITEVTNTFREMKPYLLGPATKVPAPTSASSASQPANSSVENASFHLRVPKFFYVSPFSDVDVAFDFRLRTPGERLDVRIDDYDGPARTLASTLTGSRQPLTDRRLAWLTIKYPLITLKIIGLIHWHALLLWLKKIPWFPKAARPADQRGVLRPHHSLAASSVSADPLQSLPKA